MPFATAFERGLRVGVDHAYAACKPRLKPTEPELVAGVFDVGLPVMDTSTPANVRVAGVFAHDTPKVREAGSTARLRCELADILVATRYVTGGSVGRSALFLQVKLGDPTYDLNHDQVRLFSAWPEITCLGKTRRLGLTPRPGAEFSFWRTCTHASTGCAGTSFINGRPWALFWSRTLPDALGDVAVGSAGEPFRAKNTLTPTDEWSQLVWDVIDAAVGKAWSVKSGAQAGSSRASDNSVLFARGDAVPSLFVEAAGGDAGALWADASARGAGNPPSDHDDGAPNDGVMPIIFVDVHRG